MSNSHAHCRVRKPTPKVECVTKIKRCEHDAGTLQHAMQQSIVMKWKDAWNGMHCNVVHLTLDASLNPRDDRKILQILPENNAKS